MLSKLETGNNYAEQPVDFKEDARNFASKIPEPRLRNQVGADLLALAEKLTLLRSVDEKKQSSLSSVESEEQKAENKQVKNIKYLSNFLVEPARIKAEAGSIKAETVRVKTQRGLIKWEEGGLIKESLEMQQDLKKMIENISRNIGIESINKVDESIKIESSELNFERNEAERENFDLVKVKLNTGDERDSMEAEFANGNKITIKPEKGLSEEEKESKNKEVYIFLKAFERKIGNIKNILKEKESEIIRKEREKRAEAVENEPVDTEKVNSLLKELGIRPIDHTKYSLGEIDGVKAMLDNQFEDIKLKAQENGGNLQVYMGGRDEILERQVA